MTSNFKYCEVPTVPDATFKRFLRFPPARQLSGEMAEAADWASKWYQNNARPWIAWTEVGMHFDSNGLLHVNEHQLESSRASRHFAGVCKGVVAFSCAGVEAEDEAQRRWEADEADSYYFLESYSAAVAECLFIELRQHLQNLGGGLNWTTHRCPGHGDWHILDNLQLMKILQENLDLPVEAQVLSSGMLTPKKSLLGLMGAVASRDFSLSHDL